MFNTRRPTNTGRGASDDGASAARVPQPPSRSTSEEATPRRLAVPTAPKRHLRRWMVVTGGALIVALLAGWLVWSHVWNAVSINTNEYQAVFLTNGTVYFGKLHMMSNGYMKLTNVFYIQSDSTSSSSSASSANPQSSSSSSDMKLVKLGNEVHGPEDAMMINRDQVTFFENLKSTGKVTQTITSYYKQNQ